MKAITVVLAQRLRVGLRDDRAVLNVLWPHHDRRGGHEALARRVVFDDQRILVDLVDPVLGFLLLPQRGRGHAEGLGSLDTRTSWFRARCDVGSAVGIADFSSGPQRA